MSLRYDGKPRSARPPGYWQKMTAPRSCIHVRVGASELLPFRIAVGYRPPRPCCGSALSVKYNCPSRRMNVTRRVERARRIRWKMCAWSCSSREHLTLIGREELFIAPIRSPTGQRSIGETLELFREALERVTLAQNRDLFGPGSCARHGRGPAIAHGARRAGGNQLCGEAVSPSMCRRLNTCCWHVIRTSQMSIELTQLQ